MVSAFVSKKTTTATRVVNWIPMAARCAPTLTILLGIAPSVFQTTAELKFAMPMSILVAQLATNFVSHKDVSACMRRTTLAVLATWMELIPGRT